MKRLLKDRLAKDEFRLMLDPLFSEPCRDDLPDAFVASALRENDILEFIDLDELPRESAVKSPIFSGVLRFPFFLFSNELAPLAIDFDFDREIERVKVDEETFV